MDTDAMTQRKLPDDWDVHLGKLRLFILEFTMPKERDALALQDTDSLKTARYIPLRNRLVMLLPAWEVGIQTVSDLHHGHSRVARPRQMAREPNSARTAGNSDGGLGAELDTSGLNRAH